MNNTPPEFVIDSQPFKYIGKDIVINKKEFGLNESTIFQINTYKDEDDDVFISTLFLKN